MILLFFLIATGSFLQTTLGFGMGIFVMMFLPMLFPFGTAVAISKIVGLAGSLCIVLRLWQKIDIKHLLPLTLPCLAIGLLATRQSLNMDIHLLKGFLGLVLFLLSLYFLFLGEKASIKPSITKAILLGALGGLGDGLFGIGGPPAALYCMACIEDKESYLASIHFHFIVTSLALIILRIAHGMVTLEMISSLLVAFAGVLFGTVMGLLLFHRLPAKLLKRLVSFFVGANGIWIMVQSFLGK